MKILITGGGGFLGSNIITKLLELPQVEVFNFSRNKYPELEEKGVTCLVGDIRSKSDIANLDLKGFEAIFHVAAKAGIWGREKDYFDINFEGTKNIYQKAKKDGVPYLIYTSSPSVVFGWEDIVNGDESLAYPKQFSSAYGESKALAEKFLIENSREEGPLIISLRPHLIWGEGDPHIFPRILARAKSGRLRQVGEGENKVDIIHVENAASAHISAYKALKSNPELTGSTYFIGQDEPVNLWQFINTILRKNQIEAVESSISFKAAYYVGAFLEKLYRFFGVISPEPPMTRFMALQLGKNHYFSHEKAKKELGYKVTVSTTEGLDRLYQK